MSPPAGAASLAVSPAVPPDAAAVVLSPPCACSAVVYPAAPCRSPSVLPAPPTPGSLPLKAWRASGIRSANNSKTKRAARDPAPGRSTPAAIRVGRWRAFVAVRQSSSPRISPRGIDSDRHTRLALHERRCKPEVCLQMSARPWGRSPLDPLRPTRSCLGPCSRRPGSPVGHQGRRPPEPGPRHPKRRGTLVCHHREKRVFWPPDEVGSVLFLLLRPSGPREGCAQTEGEPGVRAGLPWL